MNPCLQIKVIVFYPQTESSVQFANEQFQELYKGGWVFDNSETIVDGGIITVIYRFIHG